MSKKATEFQRKAMSRMYRVKEIFKPLNTGWIDENVACVREWLANIFFYRKGDTTIMIDAGYNYDRLAEKMNWLGIDPHSIRHIEDHFKYRQAVMEAYPCGHYPVFEGYNHMQYQIRDPRGFAEMLTSIAEHDGMPKLPFIRK